MACPQFCIEHGPLKGSKIHLSHSSNGELPPNVKADLAISGSWFAQLTFSLTLDIHTCSGPYWSFSGVGVTCRCCFFLSFGVLCVCLESVGLLARAVVMVAFFFTPHSASLCCSTSWLINTSLVTSRSWAIFMPEKPSSFWSFQ